MLLIFTKNNKYSVGDNIVPCIIPATKVIWKIVISKAFAEPIQKDAGKWEDRCLDKALQSIKLNNSIELNNSIRFQRNFNVSLYCFRLKKS